jgi:glycosyltransferase involved in cell wall biosynthesis
MDAPQNTSDGLKIAMAGLRGIPASYGGIEQAVEALSSELVARGNQVTVYSRSAYVDRGRTEHRGAQLRVLPQVNTKHLEAVSHTFLAVTDAVRRREVDVLHLHASGPALFSVLPRLRGLPVVATIHGLDFRRDKWGRFASLALRGALRVAATVPDRTIVVSQELREHLAREYDSEPVHIPNGVDLDALQNPEPVEGLEPGRYFAFLGRLVPEKGVHTLVEAFRRTDLDHKLALIGPPSHSADYVRRLEELAAGDPRVLFLGPRYGGEKAWLLQNAGTIVQPSTLEGMPLVLLEAGAAGTPCLISDIPEHLEVVRNGSGVNAATFRADDVDDLTRALREMVDDPARDQRAAALRDHVIARYRWSVIAADTEAVYRQAIERSGRRR